MKQYILDKFLRQSNGRPIIKEIDGLRFIAIVAVVFSHFNLHLVKLSGLDEVFLFGNPVSRFLELCANGVSIFFCISGFILAIPFIEHYLYNKEPVKLKAYYLRRLTRLEVPYLLVLTTFFLIQVLWMNESFRESLPHYISSFFYSHNIIYGRRSTINPVAWTLEIEIQFYLLLPFLVKVFTINKTLVRRMVLVSLIIGTGMLSSYFDEYIIKAHLNYSVIPYLPVFFTGFLLADLYLSNIKIKKNLVWDMVAIAGFCMVIYFAGDTRFYIQWIEYTGYILLFTGIFKSCLLNKIFINNYLIIIGGMCYSIYLLHYAIIFLVMNNFSIKFLTANYYTNLLLQAVIVLPIVLIVSTVFFLLIEKPCMDKQWPQKIMEKNN